VGTVKSVTAFITIHLALVFMACVEDVVPSGDDGVCARIKAQFHVDECGVVYEFKRPANTPSGWTEFCVPSRLLADAENMYGPAEPSPRFETYTQGLVDPPCAYQCPSKTGCNAFRDTDPQRTGGCYCPTTEP
jgi:hypothetical protein